MDLEEIIKTNRNIAALAQWRRTTMQYNTIKYNNFYFNTMVIKTLPLMRLCI